MSTKIRSPRIDYLVYVVVRVAVCIIHALPFRLACKLAGAIAWLGYHVDRRHRQVALENLRFAFPGCHTEAELDAFVRRVYQHFALLLMEILFLPRLVHASNWRRYLRFRTQEETDQIIGLVLLDRPILFATGHFGNWELSSYIMGLLGV